MLLACAILASVSVTASADVGRITFREDRISIALPAGWHVTSARINGVLDPVTIFTATTFPLRRPRSSEGICSRTLQRQWRENGAYVHLTEERDGASRKRMIGRVPRRPRHFALDARGSGGLCTPPDSGEITFRERGRAFYLFYGIGRRASATTRRQVGALVDSLRIGYR